jgi:hypothetical protein
LLCPHVYYNLSMTLPFFDSALVSCYLHTNPLIRSSVNVANVVVVVEMAEKRERENWKINFNDNNNKFSPQSVRYDIILLKVSSPSRSKKKSHAGFNFVANWAQSKWDSCTPEIANNGRSEQTQKLFHDFLVIIFKQIQNQTREREGENI